MAAGCSVKMQCPGSYRDEVCLFAAVLFLFLIETSNSEGAELVVLLNTVHVRLKPSKRTVTALFFVVVEVKDILIEGIFSESSHT